MAGPSSPRTCPVLPAARGMPAWAFVLLIEIANFAMLRRHLGRARADTLAADIGARIVDLIADATMQNATRDRVEIAFAHRDRDRLDSAIAAIAARFAEPTPVDGESFAIDLHIGASVARVSERDEVRLIEEAERALGRARSDRKSVIIDVAQSGVQVDRIALQHDLAHAIEAGHLFLHYQPKLHLRRQEIDSLEALIRWRHPVRGLILPSDFIPIAEDSGDIHALTLWTIRQVIADQAVLAGYGHDMLVYINIAGVLLSDAGFVRQACALVADGGTRIGFEITETSVIGDPDSAIAHLKILADMGIVIAIDDYGAGLSSLAYLKKLPARELKIDKLFVTQLTSSHRDPLIVRSTIDLAHALEMEVVAEGVETQAALALLSVMGCDMAQGFLISRPIGLDAMVAYLGMEAPVAASRDATAPFHGLAAAWKRA